MQDIGDFRGWIHVRTIWGYQLESQGPFQTKIENFVWTKRGGFGIFWDQTFMGTIQGPLVQSIGHRDRPSHVLAGKCASDKFDRSIKIYRRWSDQHVSSTLKHCSSLGRPTYCPAPTFCPVTYFGRETWQTWPIDQILAERTEGGSGLRTICGVM